MAVISRTVTIGADIEKVFDLISHVEELPLYTDFLTEVRKINGQTYRWVARIQGITLSWDSVITEYQRPVRLAWRSIRGLQNSGAYTFARAMQGTTVTMLMELHLPSKMLERLTAPLVQPLSNSIATQILARVKRRLETGLTPHGVEKASGKP
jgi:uncharacterized membrane protein